MREWHDLHFIQWDDASFLTGLELLVKRFKRFKEVSLNN